MSRAVFLRINSFNPLITSLEAAVLHPFASQEIEADTYIAFWGPRCRPGLGWTPAGEAGGGDPPGASRCHMACVQTPCPGSSTAGALGEVLVAPGPGFLPEPRKLGVCISGTV